MDTPFEILFSAFCGVVLTFALIFVACWCLISCSFFCFKYFYCARLNSMISVVSLASSDVSTLSGDSHRHHHHICRHPHGSSSESLCETCEGNNPSSSDDHHDVVGYLVENFAQTGSSPNATETGKVRKEDKPPTYDFPPAYESLFPLPTKDKVSLVDETVTIQTQTDQMEMTVPEDSSTSGGGGPNLHSTSNDKSRI